MDFVNFLRDFIFGSLTAFCTFLSDLWGNSVRAGLSPDWASLLAFSILIVLLLGSPFVAATMAELMGKNRFVHFMLGLVLPWIYPLYMFLKLIRKPAKDLPDKQDETVADDGKAVVGEVPASHLKHEYDDGVKTDPSLEAAPVMDRGYFARIASDEAGNPLGPYVLELLDGRIVEVSRIADALPSNVILEIIEGGRSNTIRLPYAKIKICREAKYWDSSRPADNRGETKTISFKEAGLPIVPVPMKKDSFLLRDGDVIGNNRISKKIGQGGMCSVYLARHTLLDIPVALKLISSQMLGPDDSESATRFLREAKYVAKIKHPNVVSLMDAGKDEKRSFYYIALEYMDGGSVGDIIRTTGPMDERKALKIITAAANGINVASQFNIVHRDIKPDNIMLSKDGSIKLADLGLAKETHSDSSLTDTEAHEIMGSPAYMSPEQIRNFASVDTRADIYSLGATLFHMLTGKPPFEGDTSVNVLMCALNEESPTISSMRNDISPEMEKLCLKMMDKNPNSRYQTPAELIDALRQVDEVLNPKIKGIPLNV
ncbi:MAG: serine/threonine-protein kinase [Lentisphaerae bacterium]|nr:serine/threonine-protein kinase [Lentisphaerota bacterium]